MPFAEGTTKGEANCPTEDPPCDTWPDQTCENTADLVRNRCGDCSTRMAGATAQKIPPLRCGCVYKNCGCDEQAGSVRMKSVVLAASKPTNASVLRDASIFLKEEEQRQKRILDLLSAPRTYIEYEKYLEDLREAQERELLVDLERKHLAGQLSYEEAILAKQRVMEENSAKKAKYVEEREAFELELQEFRKQELSKQKEAVLDVQKQHGKVKEVRQVTLKNKVRSARAVSSELKQLHERRTKERIEEIEKKMSAVREFKILQQIKREELNCREEQEMKLIGVSMEELRTRLTLYRRHLREELTTKREAVSRAKCRREMVKAAAAGFVEAVKKCRGESKDGKPKAVGIEVLTRLERQRRAEDEQLKLLRVKLEEARCRRLTVQGKNRQIFAP